MNLDYYKPNSHYAKTTRAKTKYNEANENDSLDPEKNNIIGKPQ
jgi:hypothetical protein